MREKYTEAELDAFAKDTAAGKIFTTLNIEREVVPSIFVPLFYMSEEASKELAETEPVMLFEYMNKSSGKTSTGSPIFYSFNFLTAPEYLIYEKFLAEYSNNEVA